MTGSAEEDSRTSDEEEELPDDDADKRVQIHISEFLDTSPLREEQEVVRAEVEDYSREAESKDRDDAGVADGGGGRGQESEAIYGVLVSHSGRGFDGIQHFSCERAEEALERYCLDREESDVVDTAGLADAGHFSGDQAEEDLEKYCLDREESDVVDSTDFADVDRFRGDQAEEDLENYCLDREESDVIEDPDSEVHEHFDSLKSRQDRDQPSHSSVDPGVVEVLGDNRCAYEPGSTWDAGTSWDIRRDPDLQARESHQVRIHPLSFALGCCTPCMLFVPQSLQVMLACCPVSHWCLLQLSLA